LVVTIGCAARGGNFLQSVAVPQDCLFITFFFADFGELSM